LETKKRRKKTITKETIEIIEKNLSKLPEFLTSQDLVNLGLYKNRPGVHNAKTRNHAPDSFLIGHKLVFPKAGIIKFILDSIKKKPD